MSQCMSNQRGRIRSEVQPKLRRPIVAYTSYVRQLSVKPTSLTSGLEVGKLSETLVNA